MIADVRVKERPVVADAEVQARCAHMHAHAHAQGDAGDEDGGLGGDSDAGVPDLEVRVAQVGGKGCMCYVSVDRLSLTDRVAWPLDPDNPDSCAKCSIPRLVSLVRL
jgi:hypothetical protein